MIIDGGKIFGVKDTSSFQRIALEIFNYQAQSNPVYKKFIQWLKINPAAVDRMKDIPFLPISFFKSHRVISGTGEPEMIFISSGTTGTEQSKHFVTSLSLYEESFERSFETAYGDIKEYCLLALLPSYLEREGSSLIWMTEKLIKKTKHPLSGFYLDDHLKLLRNIADLKRKKQKTILLGVSFALLDLAEKHHPDLSGITVMETGGMKGRRKEMIREELHEILCTNFNVKEIHSEYGMTELLSQAYSKRKGIFHTPPWMRILVRDVNDPASFVPPGTTGGLNIIDLANVNSCSFIATQDLGKVHDDGSFEILGRFDDSDLRGCNLMV